MTNITPDNTQQNADNVSAWSLIKPYWVSEERGIAWGLLIAIIAINMTVVCINVRLNQLERRLLQRAAKQERHTISRSCCWFSPCSRSRTSCSPCMGAICARCSASGGASGSPHRYLEQWLGDSAFYRIERDRLADNPDQRISDDLQSFATTTLSLSLDLLSTLVTLVTFITILWSSPAR